MDGRRVVSGSDDRTLRVWDVNTGQSVRVLKGHGDVSSFHHSFRFPYSHFTTQRVTSVCAVSDGRRVVSGSTDSTLRIWDVNTGESKLINGQVSELATKYCCWSQIRDIFYAG
jgi:WD40 repeat protein